MTFCSRFLGLLFSFVLMTILAVAAMATPIDYSAPGRRVETSVAPPNESRVLRIALGIGRASGELNATENKRIYDALISGQPIPPELDGIWQRLVRIGQAQAYLETQNEFFSVGYEFETGHRKKSGFDSFENGYSKFRKMIDETFGVKKAKMKEIRKKGWLVDYEAFFTDDSGREWPLMTEYVRRTSPMIGWEQVTPPFRQSEDLQNLSAFRIRLGHSKYGLWTEQTGLHQTNALVTLPKTGVADSHRVGLVAANRILLQAQYAPAIFELLDVQRGGAYKNMFMRPMVLDHQAMLSEIQKVDPAQVDLNYLQYLMRDKYIDVEFNIQIQKDELAAGMTEKERKKRMKILNEMTKKERAQYRPAWKYRDGQLKILPSIPEQALWELRVGDYVADRPEITLLQTLLEQRLTAKANELATQGVLFQAHIPPRFPEMTDEDYWTLLKSNPENSVGALFSTMGIDQDPTLASLLKKESFKVKDPSLTVGASRSYAFEGESKGESLVNFIVPRDPNFRREWRSLSREKRIKLVEKMGFAFNGKYSPETYRILATEFTADIATYPFLSPDLHLEASGNWEIKSNPRAIPDLASLKFFAKQIRSKISDQDWIAFHMHEFLPQADVARITGEAATAFKKNLERRSLYMALAGYAEADPKGKRMNYLDSWSLDRFSPQDLQKVEDHLNGKISLGSLDQKYHNIAFRPVKGGLDIEARDIDDDVKGGLRHIESIDASVRYMDFGDPAWSHSPPIFNEFREHQDLTQLERYTLEGAVAARHSLTPAQRRLLHKMQFEAYRPVMGPWMFFDDFYGLTETPAHLLNPQEARANFENNIAIPLLNYEEQNFISAAEKAKIADERNKFVDRIYQLTKKVEVDPKYRFLGEYEDFMHLAEYMRRSTHPAKPNVNLVPVEIATAQREALRDLIDALRLENVRFVRSSGIAQTVYQSLPTEVEILARAAATGSPVCNGIFKKIELHGNRGSP